jgi:ABC-type multidrug transport system fused ATPase/permease subunit
VIITPVNIFAARRYTAAQTSLMKFRDDKMAVITEVLQGIRQIKFSALEDQWERKIRDIRNTELQAQWTAFLYDIALISIWILGPIMLSAVSLGVYSLTYGELSASVAFTTMALFASMELTLAILPELISDFIEAWVSAGRIEKYLNSAEKVNCTVPAAEISFEKANIAWPVDEEQEAQERFVLRNVSLNLPPKALTVISGKTGSGKSLLLASILGESEILEGIIRVPVSPPLEERFDEQATKANWIIDSAIAFVAQVPWIENASIRDNILFGLPFDSERYHKVLFACALEKDLEMLPDGELTDIGANGINLSGGQKWRVSFARALYSRAGILVMDDIFSALDAHTGRHLHIHALTGELGQGRTRILVTHHVALCLPETDYSVYLENGTVAHAGSVEVLRRSGSLEAILAHADSREAETPNTIEGELSSVMDESNGLHSIHSHRPQSRPILNANSSVSPVAPKKFQQDERRETGAIKFVNYKRYFQNSGGGLFWVCVLLAFMLYAAFAVGRVSAVFREDET